MERFSLSKFDLKNKTILLRVDYNVPLDNGKVSDDSKIRNSLPTIKFLLQQNCKIVLATHLGRPQGKFDSKLKVDPLAKELRKKIPKNKILKLNDCIGKDIKEKIEKSKPKDILLLENLRFYQEEEKNDFSFAHSLANLADIYINDAFSVSHRKHASVDAITKFIPSLGGISLEKEIIELNKALNPKKPSVWIMGGAKLNKISLVNQALKKADYVLVGGALAFSFLKAKNISVGMSKVDYKSINSAEKILKKSKNRKKIVLPLDFKTGESISPNTKTEIVDYNKIRNDQIGLDLGPETIKLFKQYLRKAHTIVWNGPLGYFELVKFSESTKEIGRFLGRLTATTILGGGETSQAIKKFHLEHNLTHISTGGGASLSFLSGEKLPAITALEKNFQVFKKKIISY